jgi:hypothetical protein
MKKLIFISILFIAACKDSETAQWNAMGKSHIITLYGCDGKAIRTWESTGSVSNEEHSDGYYFEDAATNKLVEVGGTVVIEVK